MSEEMTSSVLTLIDIEQVGEDYFIFNFDMPKGIKYKEGQYGAFKHVDKDIEGRQVRAFSYASSPSELVFKIGTKIVSEPSDFKAKMRDLKKGDTMTVNGPLGDMTFEQDHNAVFLAAGIGITPVRSIIKQIESSNYDSEAILLYAEHREYYCFTEDFAKMKKVTVKYENTGVAMKATAAVMGSKYKNDAYYYVSGPPGYVTAVTTILQGEGVDSKQIKFDKFMGY